VNKISSLRNHTFGIWYILLFCSFALLGTNSAVAGGFEIFGKILNENKKGLANVTIQITSNGKIIVTEKTSPNGKFSFKVPLNGEYIFKVSSEGYVPKSVEIYTSMPDKLLKKNYKFEFDIKMIKQTADMDLAAMTKPAGLVFWNDERKYFDYEKGFTIAYKKKLDEEKKEVTKKIETVKKKPEKVQPKTESTKDELPEKVEQPIKVETKSKVKTKSTATKVDQTDEKGISSFQKEQDEQKLKEAEGKFAKEQEVQKMLEAAKEVDRENKIKADQATPKKVLVVDPRKDKMHITLSDSLSVQITNKQDVVTVYKEQERIKIKAGKMQYSHAADVEKTLQESVDEERKRKEEQLAKLKANNPDLFEGGSILNNPPKIKEKVIEEFWSTTYKTIFIYPARNDTFKKVSGVIGDDSFYKNNTEITGDDYNSMLQILDILKNNK